LRRRLGKFNSLDPLPPLTPVALKLGKKTGKFFAENGTLALATFTEMPPLDEWAFLKGRHWTAPFLELSPLSMPQPVLNLI
jgi:hypothetical protein